MTRPRLKVLIVDDDEDIRSALGEILADEGYAIDSAPNGREALEKLRSPEAPDVIVLDLMMPIMNGWEFREAQRQDARLSRIPVVVLSASPDAGRHAESLGAAGHVGKPVRLETLLEILDRVGHKTS